MPNSKPEPPLVDVKRDWIPLLVTLAVNLIALGVIYGKLDQRVTTLELLRVEARVEVQAQLSEIRRTVESTGADVKALIGRR